MLHNFSINVDNTSLLCKHDQAFDVLTGVDLKRRQILGNPI